MLHRQDVGGQIKLMFIRLMSVDKVHGRFLPKQPKQEAHAKVAIFLIFFRRIFPFD